MSNIFYKSLKDKVKEYFEFCQEEPFKNLFTTSDERVFLSEDSAVFHKNTIGLENSTILHWFKKEKELKCEIVKNKPFSQYNDILNE